MGDVDTFILNSPSECVDIFTKQYTLTILALNIRSIAKNFDQIPLLLHELKINVDILILSEAWIRDLPHLPQLIGYNYRGTQNNANRADGVVVYTKEGIIANIYDLEILDCTGLLIEINDIRVLALYRSPSVINIERFLDSLHRTVTHVNNDNVKHCIIAGDINISTTGRKHHQADDYEGLMSEMGFVSTINTTTRPENGTCIDHIYVKSKNNLTAAVAHTTITDHYSTILGLHGKQNKTKADVTKVKKIIDYEGLRGDISKEEWTETFSNDVDIATVAFLNTLNYHIHNNTTIKMTTHKLTLLKPWMNTGIIKCIKKRDKLHKQMRRFPNNKTLQDYYKRYRNICTSIIKRSKEEYYRKKIETDNFNPKTVWRVVSEMSNGGSRMTSNVQEIQIGKQVINNKSEVTQHFNRYFTNVGANLAQAFKSTPTTTNATEDDFTLPDIESKFKFTHVNEDDILKTINLLKSDSAPGPDGISAGTLKFIAKFIAKPLVYITNLTLDKGKFPQVFKTANVTPIFKDGDKRNPKNYRPISVINTISKILEKLTAKQLTTYFETHDILSDGQHGFRPGRGTADAILELTKCITENLDRNKHCIGIFLDLAKAFDTVPHDKLITKLERLGVIDVELDWFRSYITGRTQQVKIDSETSESLPCSFGVPQGSTLGPILFLVYINDLCQLQFQGSVLSYADDTVLLFHEDTWDLAFDRASAGLELAKRWLDNNLLTLNEDKTKYMTFSIDNRQQPNTGHHITLHKCDYINCSCLPLERTKTIKYLGIVIDQNLKWTQHIEATTKRTRKLIYIFKNIRNILNINLLRTVYYALAQTLLTYGQIGWGGMARTNLDPLVKAQKALLRVITKKPYRSPSDDLYTDFKVLDVRQLYIRSVLVRYRRDLMRNTDKDKPGHKHNTRHKEKQIQLKMRTVYGQRHYAYLGPKLYNIFDSHIGQTLSATDNQYKRRVSHWLSNSSRDKCESWIY